MICRAAHFPGKMPTRGNIVRSSASKTTSQVLEEAERRLGTGIGLLTQRRCESREPALGRGGRRGPSRSAGWRRRRSPIPAIGRSSRTATMPTRTLVLFVWEVCLEWTASLRAIRRDVRPRGHRGGIYPLMRGALCLRPRPDRLRRPHRHDARTPCRVRDLLELRRGRAPLGARARRHARGAAQARRPLRPHRARTPLCAAPVRDRRSLRSRADPGRAFAAQRLRPRRAGRALARPGQSRRDRRRRRAEREVGNAVADATGKKAKKPKNDVSDRDVVVLGSGNLGLIYLMEERRRLTLEEIDERHPDRICSSLPSACRLAAGSLLRARSSRDRRQRHRLPRRGRRRRGGSARDFSPTAPQHLLAN